MPSKGPTQPNRELAARAFTAVEDIVYVGLGILLAGSSIALLVSGGVNFVQILVARSLTANIVPLLDRILLILLVIELCIRSRFHFGSMVSFPNRFFLLD